jgi:hypothetical protein
MADTVYKRDYAKGKKTPEQKRDAHRQMMAMKANRRKKPPV